jgi:4-diphosphocytidyl-2-C-methyl-D-erythritol kinase
VSDWRQLAAPAKLNLALVVGPVRPDGKHEVATVLERLTLADTVAVREAAAIRVEGFEDDTLVRAALEALESHAGRSFEARIDKRIPVAAGLGGGSSDAAAALLLANELLRMPLALSVLESIAASLGVDVPFFLAEGPQLATGDGTTLEPIAVPRDHAVLLVLPTGAVKSSTADVYAAFDARDGSRGFDGRRAELLRALERLDTLAGLAALPPNDLASSPLAERLRELGAIRADVTGAGPVVYGLFPDKGAADHARAALGDGVGGAWIAEPG